MGDAREISLRTFAGILQNMLQRRMREITRLTPRPDGAISAPYQNFFRNNWEFMRAAEVVESTPPSIQVAFNNTCNFKCNYCADHRVGNEIPRNELSDQIRDSLGGVIANAFAASFHGISEFFIDKRFFSVVDQCRDASTILSLNTNASVCTDRHIEALASYPHPIAINFSVDAASAETFAQIRGWDFWRVIGNIRKYMTAFVDRRERTLATTSFVVCKSNVHEMVPFVYLSHSLGMDGIRFYPLLDTPAHHWQVSTKAGKVFDYHEEMSDRFPNEFRRQGEEVQRAADLFGLFVEVPLVPTSEPETVDVRIPNASVSGEAEHDPSR